MKPGKNFLQINRLTGMFLLLLLCIQTGGAKVVLAKETPAVTQQITYASIFLDTLSNVAHPSMAVDGKGGVHLALEPVSPSLTGEGGLPVQYAYCASNCLNDESWQVIRVGEAGLPGSEVRIRLNPAGKPRLLWFSQANWDEDGAYRYASCDNNCTQPANWQSFVVALDSVGPGEGRYFALDTQGNPHFLYTNTDSNHSGTFYRYCLDSCLLANSWREVQLSDNYLLGTFSLAFDTKNRLHLALSADQDEQSALLYLTCAVTCESVTNWQIAQLGPLGVGLEFSLQLDASDHPRLAVFTGEFDDEQLANRLFYLWCNTQCQQAANWSGVDMGLADGEGGNMDFVLDKQSRPHFALTTSVYDPEQIDYVYCSSQCDTNPVWQRHKIEDGEGTSCYWYVGKRPSLVWLTGGDMLMVYGVEGRCVGQETTMQLVHLVGLQGVEATSSYPGLQVTAQLVQPTVVPSLVSTPTPLPDMPATNQEALSPVALLGKRLGEHEVADFILGNNCIAVRMHYVCKAIGVELSLDTGQKVVTVFLYAEGADGFKEYKGELPFGLSWIDTRADVEEKLGAPTVAGGEGSINYWVMYQLRKLGITYDTLSASDLAATMHHLQIQTR